MCFGSWAAGRKPGPGGGQPAGHLGAGTAQQLSAVPTGPSRPRALAARSGCLLPVHLVSGVYGDFPQEEQLLHFDHIARTGHSVNPAEILLSDVVSEPGLKP